MIIYMRTTAQRDACVSSLCQFTGLLPQHHPAAPPPASPRAGAGGGGAAAAPPPASPRAPPSPAHGRAAAELRAKNAECVRAVIRVARTAGNLGPSWEVSPPPHPTATPPAST
jgi:hypothetical protein